MNDNEMTQVLIIVGSNIALVFGIFGTVIAMFLWNRSEAREDRATSESILRQILHNRKESPSKRKKRKG